MLLLLIASGFAVVAVGVHHPMIDTPTLPPKAHLSALSGDSLELHFDDPILDGGSAVQSYQVIYLIKKYIHFIIGLTLYPSKMDYCSMH